MEEIILSILLRRRRRRIAILQSLVSIFRRRRRSQIQRTNRWRLEIDLRLTEVAFTQKFRMNQQDFLLLLEKLSSYLM